MTRLDDVLAEAMRQEFSVRDRDTDEPVEPLSDYQPSAAAILRRKDVREALVEAVRVALAASHYEVYVSDDGLTVREATNGQAARAIVARMLGDEYEDEMADLRKAGLSRGQP